MRSAGPTLAIKAITQQATARRLAVTVAVLLKTKSIRNRKTGKYIIAKKALNIGTAPFVKNVSLDLHILLWYKYNTVFYNK